MSGDGFSADWLALREPADHAARSRTVADAVRRHFAGRSGLRIVDLGCGAGSNLRGTFDLLPLQQDWTLVDYDPRLLSAARERLEGWADSRMGDRLTKGAATLTVATREADLSAGADHVLAGPVDLVTAAALFDLCSVAWLDRFAATLAARRLPLYTVLTYDGRDRFHPLHPLDGAMLAAFHADMRRDKGFGPAAGPDAASGLIGALERHGYRVVTGDSPWVLDMSEPLAIELAKGFTQAVIATGKVDADSAQDWLQARLSGGTWETGHTDLFALPA